MTAEERQSRLEEHLQQVEFASLEELSKLVGGVSASTVRRDLNALEATGFIRRTHGGARLINPKSDEFAFSARDTHELNDKELIGRTCASLIRSGQTIIMDAGTTVFHVANNLQDNNLQIVTNSLPVANLFASARKSEVVVTGGVIYPRLGVLVGPLAVHAFSEIHADVAIMGAGGITLDGLTNSHALLIDIQRAMLKSAARVIFCLDHTKFGRKSVAFLCSLEAAPTVITDPAAPPDLVNALRHKGLEVVLASGDGGLSARDEPTELQESGGATALGIGEGSPENAVATAEPEAAASMVGWD
jgi:DeoR family transcriptional regulator, fructose operon transcriptional repressor